MGGKALARLARQGARAGDLCSCVQCVRRPHLLHRIAAGVSLGRHCRRACSPSPGSRRKRKFRPCAILLACSGLTFAFLLLPQILLLLQLAAYSIIGFEWHLQATIPIVAFPNFQLALPAGLFLVAAYMLRRGGDGLLVRTLEFAADRADRLVGLLHDIQTVPSQRECAVRVGELPGTWPDHERAVRLWADLLVDRAQFRPQRLFPERAAAHFKRGIEAATEAAESRH